MKESTPLEVHGPASVVDPPLISELGGSAKLNRGGVAWSIFEGGRDPYVILITIYIFAPYFAKFMVGDPVKSQALVANITTIQSLFVALTAPFLGASIEMFGRRKPLLFGFVSDVTHNVQFGYAVPLACFVVIAWFARAALAQDSRDARASAPSSIGVTKRV